MSKIKVLVVDDSALMRRTLKQILLIDNNIEVVGLARDGQDAANKAFELKPDVITMDINMPFMDGITSMQHILEESPNIAILIISSLSTDGALVTFEALELGAFDYVAKPSGTVSSNIHIIGREIIEKVKAAYNYSKRKARSTNQQKFGVKHVNKKLANINTIKKNTLVDNGKTPKNQLSKIVIIGISTGGPNTLLEILPMINENIKASIIIVQHMPAGFTSTFANRLNEACSFEIKEAKSGDELIDGKGFLAPGGMQLNVRKNIIRITDKPQTLFMPSVDITVESLMQNYEPKEIVGVLMTGMGSDGAESMAKLRNLGGSTIAEDESTAIVYGMPRELIERNGATRIVPAYDIPKEIERLCRL